jgi:glycosyltransferase involved in cell wall biosynthesis
MAKLREVKTLNWIPDFQYVHLPEMFSKKELKMRSLSHQYLLKESDAIVLSSYDALKDLKSIAPDRYINKVHVLQFVSQPDESYAVLDNKEDILKKFGIKKDFFYIPNQFWKHKNHMLVFEAIKQLKSEGIDICLVCTGYLLDHRNLGYIDEIKVFIEDNQLGGNIRLLGLVEYADVFALIKYSKAVINPSLFEGWSSTVEECKSVNKAMLLSNLSVHKEQYPQATFFDRYNVDTLKEVLVQYEYKSVDNIQYDLKERTSKFAAKYVSIVEHIMSEETSE